MKGKVIRPNEIKFIRGGRIIFFFCINISSMDLKLVGFLKQFIVTDLQYTVFSFGGHIFKW